VEGCNLIFLLWGKKSKISNSHICTQISSVLILRLISPQISHTIPIFNYLREPKFIWSLNGQRTFQAYEKLLWTIFNESRIIKPDPTRAQDQAAVLVKCRLATGAPKYFHDRLSPSFSIQVLTSWIHKVYIKSINFLVELSNK
jgi:hypothetical protein